MIKEQWEKERVGPNATTPRYRQPREDTIVFAPDRPLLTGALRDRIRQRQLAVTDGGHEVATLERCAGTSCRPATSHPHVKLPSAVFDEAQILQAYPNGGMKIWGRHKGVSGVWMLSPIGLRLIAAMDVLERVLRSPLGNVAVGYNRKDPEYQTYVLGDAMVVPRGTVLAYDERGVARGLIPMGNGRSGQWLPIPAPSRSARNDEPGTGFPPLPFRAESVAKAYFRLGRLECLVRDGEFDAVWRDVPKGPADDQVTRMTTPVCRGGLDDVWTSRDTQSIAELLRIPRADGSTYQRLMVNGKGAYEGSFFANEFRWSPNGTRFVAHLSLVDSDGNQQKQLLVADEGRRETIRAGASAYEPLVDDDGRLAYVVEDGHRRRLVADSVTTEGDPYAWNVSQEPDAAVANVLRDGMIRRIVLPYDR